MQTTLARPVKRRTVGPMATAAGLACLFSAFAATALLAQEETENLQSQPAEATAPRAARQPTPEQLRRWFKPLARVGVSIDADQGPLPLDASDALLPPLRLDAPGNRVSQGWAATEFHWQASELFAQPAYFDNVPLERYGQTIHPIAQPVISATRFYTNFFVIPYKLGLDGTHDRIYALGYYRPGSPTPPVRQRLPWDHRAALIEASTLIGIALILP